MSLIIRKVASGHKDASSHSASIPCVSRRSRKVRSLQTPNPFVPFRVFRGPIPLFSFHHSLTRGHLRGSRATVMKLFFRGPLKHERRQTGKRQAEGIFVAVGE